VTAPLPLPPLPVGWSLSADPDTAWTPDRRSIHGGSPWRLLRLTDAGVQLASALLAGDPVGAAGSGALARRLVEAGLAHPVPPPGAPVPDLEVVVPAYGRPDALDRCLTALDSGDRVLVVDDGSADARAVAAVAGGHGARLHRLGRNGGPAAARNAGLRVVTAPVVAFVDSDCVVGAGLLDDLARRLGDPLVAAVAPRVRPAQAGDAVLARLADVASPLDLGDRPGTVRPHGSPSYVPAAVLVVRAGALRGVGGFDESLRYGEDVDLVWRLHDAGFAVRYDPSLVARHSEPQSWDGWLRRRFHYGSSAGPLARRHGDRLAGPDIAGLVTVTRLPAALAGAVPPDVARDLRRRAVSETAAGVLRWAPSLWAPAALALTGPARGGLAVRAGAVADGLAYGAGVWWGAVRARTAVPLLPRWRRAGVSSSTTTSDP
jgi:mycofactocin glycosyltransferase